MRLRHRLLALVVTCTAPWLLFAGAAHAGAWTKPAGSGYLKLGSATFVSDHGYDFRGQRVDSDTFLLHAETLYGYAEVGLTDDVTLLGYVPYILATNQHASGVNFHALGVGDGLVGAQIHLLQTLGVVVSGRVELKAPLYQGAPSIQGRQSAKVPGFPRSATLFPALGDGQVDLTTFVSAGSGLPSFGGYVDGFVTVDVGYRLRTGALTDAVVLNASGGIWLLPGHLLLMANSAWVATLPSADELRVLVGKGYWSFGPAMMVPVIGGLSLEVGFDVVTAGVNAAGGMQALFGVSYAY